MAKLQLQDCQVCGFTFKKVELRKQNGLWKCTKDFDIPKPSNKSLGGRGEIGASDSRVNSDTTDTPSEVDRIIHYINSTNGITVDRGVPWMIISGSGTEAVVEITKNPQISAGEAQEELLTLHCISNSPKIKIAEGTGVSLRGGASYTMGSGDILVLCYRTDNSVWQECNRGTYLNT